MTTIYLVGLLAAPVAGYLLAGRRPNATRLDLLRGATLGGAVLGGLLALLGQIHLLRTSTLPLTAGEQLSTMLYFIVTCTVAGLVVGALGLLARAIGA